MNKEKARSTWGGVADVSISLFALLVVLGLFLCTGIIVWWMIDTAIEVVTGL